MLNVSVTCDSACDLPRAVCEKSGITVIPMGGDSRQDGAAERTGWMPGISAVPAGEYERRFRALAEQGREVVHVSVSSGLSSGFRNACAAAAAVGNVFVVDSRSLSAGAGHLALLAAELAEAELAGEEIAEALNDMKQGLDVSFLTRSMEYFHKCGVFARLAALGADSLRLRPELEMAGGKLRLGRRHRGGMEKAVASYVRGRLEGQANIQHDRIFITHCGVPREAVDLAAALVRKLQPFDEVIETEAGSALAACCGPCCLGLQFFRKKRLAPVK